MNLRTNAKLRADNARLTNRLLCAEAEKVWAVARAGWLVGENRELHKSLADAVENNRKLSIELFRALGHPSVLGELKRVSPWN